MRVGTKYADNKIYRGIKHSDGLPLLAEDLHEFSDTLYEKNKYLLESILGSGILTDMNVTVTNGNIILDEPVTINLFGDVFLLGSSEDTPLVQTSELIQGTGVVCVVGWYQNIDSTTSIREYGGVRNTVLQNDLLYQPLNNIQVSSRYQFRWDIISIPLSGLDVLPHTIGIPVRDKNGTAETGSFSVRVISKEGSVYRAIAPNDMDYAVSSEIYVLPLFEYTKTGETVSDLLVLPKQRSSGGMSILTSNTEPTGIIPQGTVWYNPTNREFKTYIEGTGFVSVTAHMGFVQYQYVDIATTDVTTAQNLVYDIDVPSLYDTDIVNVTYEGIALLETTDYTINHTNKTITLLNFTRIHGEKLVVTVTRLTEASDVANITSTITTHIETVGSGTVEGHVKLSDTPNSSLGVNSGYAITPKALADSQAIVDSVTNQKYAFGVENGILYIEEV